MLFKYLLLQLVICKLKVSKYYTCISKHTHIYHSHAHACTHTHTHTHHLTATHKQISALTVKYQLVNIIWLTKVMVCIVMSLEYCMI